MKRLNQELEIFHDRLREFEKILAKYSYGFVNSEHSYNPDIPIESMTFVYGHKDNGLRVDISFVIGELDLNSVLANFGMSNSNDECFFLDEFHIANPDLPVIETKIKTNKNYSENLAKFFKDLEKAFETYLNDQITGKSFEDHSQQLLQEYYSYSEVYDMQKQIVEEGVQKREAQVAKGSLWDQLVRLFKD